MAAAWTSVWAAPVIPLPACWESSDREAIRVSGALWRGRRGERPPRAGQRRAALHAGMGDILKIVRRGAIRIKRGCDGGDFHSVSAIRAGEH
jgi:hypothetical protein